MRDEHGHLPGLSPDDQRLLDALVECGFDADALHLDEAGSRRARAILDLLGLMKDYPVEDADEALLDATLARVDRVERERTARMSIETAAERPRGAFRIRLPDFISVAAVLLIAAAIGLPMLKKVRQDSIDARCSNNLRVMGYAFGTYAADYGGDLPVARAGLSGDWRMGASNVLNLEPLIKHDYCDLGHLDCPGHDGNVGEGYSYKWHLPGTRAIWGTGQGLVLGDRNPLIDALRAGRWASPLSSSVSHGGRGQNVLSSDGGTMWLDRAVIGKGDNIWMPEGVDGLRDGIRPASAGDVFLAH